MRLPQLSELIFLYSEAYLDTMTFVCHTYLTFGICSPAAIIQYSDRGVATVYINTLRHGLSTLL